MEKYILRKYETSFNNRWSFVDGITKIRTSIYATRRNSDWSAGPLNYVLSSYVVHQNLEAPNRTTSSGSSLDNDGHIVQLGPSSDYLAKFVTRLPSRVTGPWMRNKTFRVAMSLGRISIQSVIRFAKTSRQNYMDIENSHANAIRVCELILRPNNIRIIATSTLKAS